MRKYRFLLSMLLGAEGLSLNFAVTLRGPTADIQILHQCVGWTILLQTDCTTNFPVCSDQLGTTDPWQIESQIPKNKALASCRSCSGLEAHSPENARSFWFSLVVDRGNPEHIYYRLPKQPCNRENPCGAAFRRFLF